MHSYEFISHSEEETIRFADEFASKLNGHSKIVLSGDLGLERLSSQKDFLDILD